MRLPAIKNRSLRRRGKIGWQAKTPAPPRRKRLRTNVGQTLSSVNPAVLAILSHLLSSVFPMLLLQPEDVHAADKIRPAPLPVL